MELRQYHLNFRGMNRRVVRFCVLDVDQVEKAEDNAARLVGEDASASEVRRAQLKMLVATMIIEYTDPGQEPLRVPDMKDGTQRVVDGKPATLLEGGHADPEKLKDVKWHKAEDPASMLLKWKTLFGAKETAALTILFRDYHEVNQAELQMLLGKALPVSTGD